MTLKRDMKHPNFILGSISYLLLLTGIVILSENLTLGRQLIAAAFIAGAIHWTLSIVDINNDPALDDERSRYFWLASTIMIPPLGGMIYYMIQERKFTF